MGEGKKTHERYIRRSINAFLNKSKQSWDQRKRKHRPGKDLEDGVPGTRDLLRIPGEGRKAEGWDFKDSHDPHVESPWTPMISSSHKNNRVHLLKNPKVTRCLPRDASLLPSLTPCLPPLYVSWVSLWRTTHTVIPQRSPQNPWASH